ncbi:protein of unknown function [Pseudorhizobium banfieldiae]|uniref:Uncharacterized protein n=1 Tax=Pseudorhizobium banfieldiae TaxID=1125847 RepID=L0NAL9_9HYPH|nr:protein of unknown function [Pseudorhizobium banfieldiae]
MCSQFCERYRQDLPSRDNDIVVSGFHCKPGALPHGLLEASAHAVSLDGVAVLFGHREAGPGWRIRLVPVKDLQKEGAAPAALALAHGKKLRPAFQPPDSRFRFLLGRHCPVVGHVRPLGRETLATTCATSCKNLAATIGRHAGTKAMAALADKLGWLIGTLRHLFKYRGVRPFLIALRQQRFVKTSANSSRSREPGRLNVRGL